MTAATLLLALELTRSDAAAHSWRVADLSARVGAQLGLPDDRLATLRLAGLLHDVGKLKVRKEILAKPSPLTPDERAIVRRHADLGAHLLDSAGVVPEAVQLVHRHHERLDGSGYPLGLTADELNVEARILAVCDVFDALTSDRPYASAWPQEQALKYLQRDAGRTFDHQCVDALQEVLEVASPLLTAA